MSDLTEELFQEFLTSRARISNKGKRVNTDRAVKSQRKRLMDYQNEGYDPDFLINHAMDNSWLGIFRVGEPKQIHHKPTGATAGIIHQVVENSAIPKGRDPQLHADKVRRQAIEAMRRLGI